MVKRIPSDINLLFAVDKPLGCTSHDVVSRVRRALGVRRVGHAGTLDPLATGVMVLGVGQATRLLGMLTLDRKSYIASVSFGSETNTDDSEGEVTRTAPVDAKLKCMPAASWIRLWGLRCRFRRHSRRFPSMAFAPTSVRERERAWIFPPVLSRFSSFSSSRFWLTGSGWFGISPVR